MCLCLCVYGMRDVCMFMCDYMCMYTHLYARVCVCVCLCVLKYVGVHVCMCVAMYMFTCVYVCVGTRVYVYVHVYICVCALCAYACAYVRMCGSVCHVRDVCVCARTRLHLCVCVVCWMTGGHHPGWRCVQVWALGVADPGAGPFRSVSPRGLVRGRGALKPAPPCHCTAPQALLG